MSNTVEALKLSTRHVDYLRKNLIKWGNPIEPHEGDKDVIDLWFIDSDVLSDFINAASGDYLSDWSSLFALGSDFDSPKRGSQVDESAKNLMDAIAIAVTYFLFGRFRDTLSVQSHRFLITPEHERELDAITIAVSFEAKQHTPVNMQALTAYYLALAKEERSEDLSNCIDTIFGLLRESSPSGKVYRTLDLRRRVLDTMRDIALFPPDKPGSAFALKMGQAFDMRVKALAKTAFDIFLDSLLEAHPPVRKYAYLKRSVFDFHDPNRRLKEYVNHVLSKFSNDLNGTVNKEDVLDGQNIIYQIKIAAREVSDVYAFARLVAMAEVLNEHHRQDRCEWRVNLLTGSNMERSLKERWQKLNTTVHQVRLVHPLSAMSIDGFARPDEKIGDPSPDTRTEAEAPGAYALRVLAQNNPVDDIEKFFSDFKSLLSAAAVSHAPSRERWMRSVRMVLNNLDPASRNAYLRAVRDVISRDFVATFAQINQIPTTNTRRLPSTSLPTLALPIKGSELSDAQIYVMKLHESPPDSLSAAPSISKLIKADQTGYSALLCAGLGYLAQGQDWLPLAESAANTAVAFASTLIGGDTLDDHYPEGNEAFYLAAFISRMQVDGSVAMRNHACDWLQHHRYLMNQAMEILEKWETTEIGRRNIAQDSENESDNSTLAELVRVRYEAESLAADVFGHLIDRLEKSDPKLMHKPPLDCLADTLRVMERWSTLNNAKLKSQYCADVRFIGAQLSASFIQAWLCVLADRGMNEETEDKLLTSVYEDRFIEWVDLPAKGNPAPGSTLVKILLGIFFTHIDKEKLRKHDLQALKRALDSMDFASLDERRKPLFKQLLDQPEAPVASFFGESI